MVWREAASPAGYEGSAKPGHSSSLFKYTIGTTDKLYTMGDDEHDYTIENTDAGASATIPMEAGQIKKGG